MPDKFLNQIRTDKHPNHADREDMIVKILGIDHGPDREDLILKILGIDHDQFQGYLAVQISVISRNPKLVKRRKFVEVDLVFGFLLAPPFVHRLLISVCFLGAPECA